jgi:TnpA family transposase
MTTIERTAYPRLKSRLTQRELDETFTPTPVELALTAEATKADDEELRLNLLVSLKCFQHLGYFLPPEDVPARVVRHMRSSLQLPARVAAGYDWPRTMYRHRQAIRDYLGIRQYDDGGEALAAEAVQRAAQTMGNPADLINAAIGELVRQRFELPAFSTLDHLVQRIRTEVNTRWCEQILSTLSAEDRQLLDSLHLLRDDQSRTDFTALKKPPGKAVISQMERMRRRLRWLEGLMDTNRLLAGIPPARIELFAAEARVLEATHILDFAPVRRYTLLVCFLHRGKVETRDNLIEIFLKRVRLTHQQAQEDLDAIREQQRVTAERLIELLARITHQAERTADDAALGGVVRALLGREGGATVVRGHCAALSVYHGNNILPLLWNHYRNHRKVLFGMVDLLEIRSTTQDRSLVEALAFVKQHRRSRSAYLPASISIDFASQLWQQLITHRQDGEAWYDRHQLEVCVFSHVAAELRSGDLYVVGSENYADYREQLLGWEECLPLLEDYCQMLGLATSPGAFVDDLKNWLADTAEEIDRLFPESSQLRFEPDGRPVLAHIVARRHPPGTQALQGELRRRMPERKLLDVLALVHHLVDFTRHFGPLSGSDPKLANPTFNHLMTVFAYGCNLGPEQTARHSRGAISSRALAFANHQHITTEKLDAALVDIINTYNRFDLPGFWGTGKSAAADGTLIDVYNNNLLSAYHVRYGRYGGIAYHHVSDTYIALFSHFISVGVWEAVYIIDGLLKNDSQIQPEMLHADTQGQSLPVFGLTHLMGIQLMPRIRNWKDLTLYRPSQRARYEHIDGLFSGQVNWKLIETHWQDLMQVVLSIQEGKLLPSMLLRKLGNHSRKNRLYRAFRELGRVVRTVFLLRYISDEALRRQIAATTNKVENYHGFTGWLTFGGDVIAHNDPVEQEKRIKYKDVVANALILQNVIDMTAILRQLLREGYVVNRDTLSKLSPYLTEHVRRFGDYVLDLDIEPGLLEFELPVPMEEPSFDEGI